MRLSSGLATLVLSAAALIGTVASAGPTTAAFTATTVNPGNAFASATLTLSNDKPLAAELVNVANLVPGDTASRTVTITNSGTAGLTYTGAISATASTLLWSDTTNGLQVTVSRGATTVYTGALKNLSLAASSTIAAGGTDTLTYVFTFPSAAGNTFQGLSQDFTITYTATQLSGTAR